MSTRLPEGSTILVIGSGPIVIGQACEFDYSGTQACKVLKSLGYRVVLINSNPATIMTDPSLADATYVEPLSFEFAKQVVEREKPDAILPTVGGQVGLNLALELADLGCLERFEKYVGATYEESELAITHLVPSEASWTQINDREVVCVAYHMELEKLTGSVRDSGM